MPHTPLLTHFILFSSSVSFSVFRACLSFCVRLARYTRSSRSYAPRPPPLNPGRITPSAVLIATRSSPLHPPTHHSRHHLLCPSAPTTISLSPVSSERHQREMRQSGLFDVFARHKDTNCPRDLRQSCVHSRVPPQSLSVV